VRTEPVSVPDLPSTWLVRRRRLTSSRGGRIGMSAMTGAFGKALSLMVQIVAVAVAVRTLHTNGFAVFVAVASLVSWMSLASLGVAPGLTLGIARAAPAEERQGEARLFVVTLILMVSVASAVLLVMLAFSRTEIIDHVLGTWLNGDLGDAHGALEAMAVLVAAQLILSVPEAAQLGYQAQYVTNLWIAIGSAATLILLLTIGPSIGSVTAFVVLSQGPQVVARALNGVTLLAARPYLLRPGGIPVRALMRPLLGSGLAFAGIQLAGYVALQFGVLVLAASSTKESVALGGVILRALAMAAGAVALVTTPMWPALTDAVARLDLGWVRRACWQLPALFMAYASLATVAILVWSRWALELWTGQRFPIDLTLQLYLAAYFMVGVWSHTYAILLIGFGVMRFTALTLLSEAMIVGALQIVLIPAFGVTGYLAALFLGTLLVSAWVLPARARLEIRRMEQN
jgi:O-antigen/teichoic acid export membrane protein